MVIYVAKLSEVDDSVTEMDEEFMKTYYQIIGFTLGVLFILLAYIACALLFWSKKLKRFADPIITNGNAIILNAVSPFLVNNHDISELKKDPNIGEICRLHYLLYKKLSTLRKNDQEYPYRGQVWSRPSDSWKYTDWIDGQYSMNGLKSKYMPWRDLIGRIPLKGDELKDIEAMNRLNKR
jgi:hypothetical protein